MNLGTYNLNHHVQQSEHLHAVRREDLRIGDVVYVRTCNSLYSIRVDEQRFFKVSGGWFDQDGGNPVKTTIAGCTWGGSVINVDVVAAVGLSIEFGNRVTTSAIQRIMVVPRERRN